MVAERIVPAEIPVHCQGEPCQGPGILKVSHKRRNRLPDLDRRDLIQMNAGILDDISVVVQVPGGVEGVAVGC